MKLGAGEKVLVALRIDYASEKESGEEERKPRMTTEERLENLEKKLSRVNRCNLWLLAGAALCLGIGLIAWAVGPAPAPAQPAGAGMIMTGAKEIRARKFVLEDENGESRGGLVVLNEGPSLALIDEKGELRAVLGVGKDGPRLDLWDENGNTRAMLSVDKDGPALTLIDENGNPRACLGGTLTKTPDGKTINYPESSLLLFDPDGTARWCAP